MKDDDCEEGEIKDTSGRPPQFTRYVQGVCRFYLRGHCTWGPNCRFVHPGVNDKGLFLFVLQILLEDNLTLTRHSHIYISNSVECFLDEMLKV